MNKNRIRLTESQLHRVIRESVKKVLRETEDLDTNIRHGNWQGHQDYDIYLKIAYKTVDATPDILEVANADRDEMAQKLADLFEKMSALYNREPKDF